MRGKPACPVLRGRGRSNALPLPDRLLHGLAKIHATFDDPNLVSRAGLVPVMAWRIGRAWVTSLLSMSGSVTRAG